MILYYDCFSGISGDMNLGALLDVGCPADYLRAQLAKIDIGPFDLCIRREKRGVIEGTRVEVITGHNHHSPRTLNSICQMIEDSSLNPQVKTLAAKIFQLLAEAEAKVHGTTKEEVHFHEIGAVDSLVDIVGAAIALDYLQPQFIWSSPVELGGGTVHCAHGLLPVPAPATVEILKGTPVKIGGQPFEATTPTGASILMATVSEFIEKIKIIPYRIGYGIGEKEGPLPNVLRLILGEVGHEEMVSTEESCVVLIETNIDDMTPEETGHLMEILLSHGAQDVFLTPIIMKKNRPAVKISVLCEETHKEKMMELIFLHSSTFGLRYCNLTKSALQREISRLNTPYGEISVKKGFYGGKIIKIKPEFEECRRIAEDKGVPVKKVMESVIENEKK